MKDAEIDYSDIPKQGAEFFANAIIWPGPKKQITLRVDPDWSTRGELLGVTRYSDLAGATKVGSTSHTYDAAEHLTAINQPPQSRAAQQKRCYQDPQYLEL